ncbi:IS1634 family transposase [Candidatus Micrarchaeota archaeon]|nr:IS1634 family transposase [Candidatus Micrarchaeota archaeon]
MKIQVESSSKAFAGGGFLAFRQADRLLDGTISKAINTACHNNGVQTAKRIELLVGQVIHKHESTREAWLDAKRTNAAAFVNLKLSRQDGRNLHRAIEAIGKSGAEALYEGIASAALEKTGVSMAVVHEDSTSQFFTGKKATRAKKGYSRDHRPDKPQVNVGIMHVKGTHFPSAYVVTPGNEHDLQIFVKLVEKAKPETLLVADRGAVSKENKALVIVKGRHYLFGEKLYDPVKREALEALPKMKRVSAGYLACSVNTGEEWRHYFLSEKLRHDVREKRLKHAKETAAEYAKSLSKKKRRSSIKRLTRITAEGEVVVVKQEVVMKRLFRKTQGQIFAELSKDEPLDGVFVLSSDKVSDSLEALREYKGKDEVEKVFCALKSSLHLRPFHARKQECVDGVIFITMLALLVVSLLAFCSHATGVAVKTMVEELRRVTLLVRRAVGNGFRRVACLNLDGLARKLFGDIALLAS